jgi:hypothetical protein
MKYPSKYSNGKSVTPAQYISELICERIAKRTKKDLHYRFWLSKEWEKQYKGQITTAHKLLKQYDAKVIIAALNSTQGVKIYSLRAPHLVDIIEQTRDTQKPDAPAPKIIERNFLDKGKIANKHTSNILDKLKEIDNGTTG